MKIQKRLLLSILPVVIAVTGFIVIVSTTVSVNNMESSVTANAQLLNSSYSDQLNYKLIQIKRISQNIANAVVTAVNVETVLIDSRKRNPEFKHIFYTALDSSITDMSPYNSSLLSYSFAEYPGWDTAISKKEPQLTNPIKFMGLDSFILFTPIVIDYLSNGESEVVGVLISVISTDHIFSNFDKVVYGETGSIFVINSDGYYIYSSNPEDIMKRKFQDIKSDDDLSYIEEAMTNLSSGIATYYAGREKYFVSFSPVEETKWSLSITGSYSEFTKDIDRLFYINILILLLGTLLASVMIYFIVREVVRPLTILTDIAEKVSHGDMSLRSKLSTRNEVGILSRAMNGMLERLSNYNQKLEEEVEDRTKELHASNEELQSMNDSMEAMNEELTATNETIEANSKEMVVMNEELIATNETLNQNSQELEAMNEELTATVEELDSTNRALEVTKDALWTEMALAKKLQTILLPEDPRIPNFEIAAFMKTTDSVGGDYYDVLNIEGRDWFVIGDVSGHGVTSGLIMMMVQTSIHIALSQNPDTAPEKLLTIINKTIYTNISKLGGNRYMTLTVFACLDDNKFAFAGAHLPIIIYREQSGELDIIETPGAWIGLVDNIDDMNQDRTFALDSGDVMLLYTDGLTEATLDSGKQFSQELLMELFKESIKLPPKKICSNIEDFSNTLTVDDDVTIMILKRL